VFEFDPRTGELRKHRLKVKLAGQPIQVLALPVAQAGELVTREELQKKLWPQDTVVEFEHSINTAINKLREALAMMPTTRGLSKRFRAAAIGSFTL
jgi:DNA-binding winged helix-turn-helix (wHTH) protein